MKKLLIAMRNFIASIQRKIVTGMTTDNNTARILCFSILALLITPSAAGLEDIEKASKSDGSNTKLDDIVTKLKKNCGVKKILSAKEKSADKGNTFEFKTLNKDGVVQVLVIDANDPEMGCP